MIKKYFFPAFTLAVVVLMFFGCSKKNKELELALDSISAEEFAKNVAVLSSDEFEGRGPSSSGEEKTVNFLKGEFQEIGLKPGNGESYFQEVPVVEITADPSAKLRVKKGKNQLCFPMEMSLWHGHRGSWRNLHLRIQKWFLLGMG